MFKNNTDNYNQHFLINDDIKNTFIKNMTLTKKDFVVEIGPGEGVISSLIAPKVNSLLLIEKDKNLRPYLFKLTKEYNNVEMIFDNALNYYIPKCDKIISSLPYNITEPFIEKLIRCDFKKGIFITGKKFASSLFDGSINKLSLLTNCFFKAEYIMDITPEAFNPMPHVMSSIITLIPIKKEDLTNYKLQVFREVFFNRTKKIKNSLIDAYILLNKLNNREAKAKVQDMNLSNEILNGNIENLSNERINQIYESI